MHAEWSPKRIGEFAWEVADRANGDEEVLSVTKHAGFVPSLDYFGKQVFSKDTSTYKLVRRGQFAYATIHLDEGSIDCLRVRDQGIISPMYTVFDVDDTVVERQFLHSLLRAPWMVDRYAAIGQGSINRRRSIGFETLAAEVVRLPPIGEQKKIAAILSSADDAIAATEAVIDQTRRMKAGVLRDLLASDRQHPMRPIADVGHCQLGQQRHPQFESGSNVRPYLRVANVLDGRIDFADLNQMHFPEEDLHKFELMPGDILLNEGQSLHLVGRSAIYRGEVPGCCVQKTLLRFRCGPQLLPDYAQLVFQHWLWSGVFARAAVQTTSMAHLTGVRFQRMPIPVPPLSEQQRVVDAVAAVDRSADLSTREKTVLGALKVGLVEDLLTGKVRVTP